MSVFRLDGAQRSAQSAKGSPWCALRFALCALRPVGFALLVGTLACRQQDAAPQAKDDAGDPLPSVGTRSRIVSLNPATTEILFALGAGDRVVGRTHWDAWPPEALQVPDLGDGIRPSVETVIGARPDLVVLYATGDNKAAATALRAAGVDVISLRIDRIAEFERATTILGDMIGEQQRARSVIDSVRATLLRVRNATRDLERPTVFMLSWETPLMTIGSGSFLTELVEIAGGQNVFGDLTGPSPQVSFEEVLRRDPKYILGRPETAGKLGANERWRGLPAVREGRVLVMDTVLVGRPGVRLGEAAVSLARLLHPGSIP
jgi:ABC-type Fe3+-hydroxamate transport system substrate-binding protein